MVLLGHFNLWEQVSIQLQCSCKVVERLLKIAVLQVSFSQLCIGSDQDKQVFFVNVDKELAESKLLNPNLNHTSGVLRHREFVKCFVSFNWSQQSGKWLAGADVQKTYVARHKFCSPSARIPVQHQLASGHCPIITIHSHCQENPPKTVQGHPPRSSLTPHS